MRAMALVLGQKEDYFHSELGFGDEPHVRMKVFTPDQTNSLAYVA